MAVDVSAAKDGNACSRSHAPDHLPQEVSQCSTNDVGQHRWTEMRDGSLFGKRRPTRWRVLLASPRESDRESENLSETQIHSFKMSLAVFHTR